MYHCPDDPNVQSVSATGTALYPVSYALNLGVVNSNGPVLLSQFANVTDIVLLDEVQGAQGVNLADPNETGSAKSPVDYSDNTVWADSSNNAQIGKANNGYKYVMGPMADINHGSGSLDSLNGGVETPGGRHSDGANYLLVDGHAKWLRGTSVATRFTGYHVQPRPASPTVVAWMFPY